MVSQRLMNPAALQKTSHLGKDIYGSPTLLQTAENCFLAPAGELMQGRGGTLNSPTCLTGT